MKYLLPIFAVVLLAGCYDKGSKESADATPAVMQAASAPEVASSGAREMVPSPCALPNPQPGIQCDGYRINP